MKVFYTAYTFDLTNEILAKVRWGGTEGFYSVPTSNPVRRCHHDGEGEG